MLYRRRYSLPYTNVVGLLSFLRVTFRYAFHFVCCDSNPSEVQFYCSKLTLSLLC